jgi:hypothetical protein
LYKPLNTVSISLAPGYDVSVDNLQYVTTIDDREPNIYVMGKLKSTFLSLSARVNFGITPDLTIQYYGQPFIFSGKYSNFKHITNATASAYSDRFHEYSNDEIAFDEESDSYYVLNKNAASNYSFDNPDFHFLQFRSNLVLRWEYKPGSVLYLVWSQGRTTDGSDGGFHFNKYTDELFSKHPQDDFLVKISYAIIF